MELTDDILLAILAATDAVVIPDRDPMDFNRHTVLYERRRDFPDTGVPWTSEKAMPGLDETGRKQVKRALEDLGGEGLVDALQPKGAKTVGVWLTDAGHPRSIVDRNRTAIRVSSVGKTPEAERQLERVVEQLNELVVDSTGHRRRLRKSGLYTLAAGVVVLALLPFVIWLLSSRGGSPPPQKKSDDRTIIAELPEHEILAKLDELDLVSKSHPPGTQLPSVEDAKKINHHLRWLAQRLEPNSGGTTGLTVKTQQRMRSAFDSLAKFVQEKAESKTHSPSNLTPILTGYLEDLPDLTSISPALTAVQSHYWQLQRGLVVEQVASIFKRRHDVGSPPIDTLVEVVTKLRSIEQDAGRSKVFGPQARQDLLQEIQTAATFCEDRKNSKEYPATFRIVSASYSADKKVDIAWRSITLQSPGQSSVDYSLEPSRKSDTELTFITKRPSYQISLGLGKPVIVGLAVHENAEDKWRKLHDFDLASEQWPLEAIGLPLLRSEQSEVTKILRWEGMELKLEFSGFPRVPPLLWDATASAKERKP